MPRRTDEPRYVVECRTPDGKLDSTGVQPQQVFGVRAWAGITADEMAQRLWRYVPGATFHRDQIARWPQVFDSRWVARRKTW